MDSKHWNDIYKNKSEKEVSWFQAVPAKSLELIDELNLSPSDSIIDIGGGDARLVDHLLSKGFQNITLLDISAVALERAKKRLKSKSDFVKYIVSDVTEFNPPQAYTLWHDRATLHFLTTPDQVAAYLEVANRSIVPGGYLIVSTFSKTGPEKCSGLPVTQYAETDLKKLFEEYFTNVRCFEDTHKTPRGSTQDFVYCGFKKI